MNMENHFNILAIFDALNKGGWDCIGGFDLVNGAGLIALDARLLAYGVFVETGENPTGRNYMAGPVTSPDDMWPQVLEAIQALNAVCEQVGLPRYMSEDRTEAHSIILRLYKDRLEEGLAKKNANK